MRTLSGGGELINSHKLIRAFVTGLERVVLAAVAVAAISALVGFIIAHFVGRPSVQGLGWGMCGGGAIIGLLVGNSGSPSQNLREGRSGLFGTFWSESSPMPQSPLELGLGGLLAFAGGIAVIVLA